MLVQKLYLLILFLLITNPKPVFSPLYKIALFCYPRHLVQGASVLRDDVRGSQQVQISVRLLDADWLQQEVRVAGPGRHEATLSDVPLKNIRGTDAVGNDQQC